MSDITSIDGLVVKFLTVIKKYRSTKTKRTHYKVAAEVKTKAGKQKEEFWFIKKSAFLRQKTAADTKATRIGFNGKQRSEILALIQKYEAASA